MIRRIFCYQCRHAGALSFEDMSEGWSERRTTIIAKLPPNQFIEIHGLDTHTVEKIPQTELVCDACNSQIGEGTAAVAVTYWRDDNEPAVWEKEYCQ